MSRAQRLKEKKLEKSLEADIHEVQVDAPTKKDALPLNERVDSLEGLLKGEQEQLNLARQEISDLKEEHTTQVELIREGHTHEMAAQATEMGTKAEIAKQALAEMVDDYEARLILGVNHIVAATEQAISMRIQALPTNWGPRQIAEKINDEKFNHPNGIRDYYPVVDQNGHIVKINGNEVKCSKGLSFRAKAKQIERDIRNYVKKMVQEQLL